MEFPDRPWVKVGAELFELTNHHNLIMADCFSKWPDIHAQAGQPDSQRCHLLYHKSDLLIRNSRQMIVDNGRQDASAVFAQFMIDHNIKHTTTIPYYPQAHEQTERTVQTV